MLPDAEERYRVTTAVLSEALARIVALMDDGGKGRAIALAPETQAIQGLITEIQNAGLTEHRLAMLQAWVGSVAGQVRIRTGAKQQYVS